MKTFYSFLAAVAIAMATNATAQVMRVAKDSVLINKNLQVKGKTILTNTEIKGKAILSGGMSITNDGTQDGLDVVSNAAENSVEPGSDLIWGCYYDYQGQNPGIFSLTSHSAAFSWSPCFTIRANGNVGIFNPNPEKALTIGMAGMSKEIKLYGTIDQVSDARLKENIQNISIGSLDRVKSLRGVTYNMKAETHSAPIPKKILEDPNFPKELLHAPAPVAEKSNSSAARKHYGFLAQEVQKVFPELVQETDSTGILSINYIGMIPILLEAIKEQQGQIEEQQTQIEELREQLTSIEDRDGQTSLSNRAQPKAVLYQNAPNPFNQSTEIRFYIPTDVQTATIYIYDINGLQKTKYPIADREEGSITISGATLDAGSYFYTLVCDGAPVASKQMVLTR